MIFKKWYQVHVVLPRNKQLVSLLRIGESYELSISVLKIRKMSNIDKLKTKRANLFLKNPDSSFRYNQETCQRNNLINYSYGEEPLAAVA